MEATFASERRRRTVERWRDYKTSTRHRKEKMTARQAQDRLATGKIPSGLIMRTLRMSDLAFIVALAVGSVSAQSQPPKPPTGQPPQTAGNAEPTAAVRDEAPADARSTSADPNWVIAFLTLGLFAVAFMQFNTNKKIEKHTRTIERAYLNVGDWGFHQDNGGMQVAFSVQNSGRTPAYDVAIALDARFGLTFPVDAIYERPKLDAETFMLNGATSMRLARSALKLSILNAPAAMRGDGKIYYWGVVRYRDAFRDVHHQRFSIACEKGGEAWYAEEGMKNDAAG